MELEEAETRYLHAKEQSEIWAGKQGSFAHQQAEMWVDIMLANSWCLPGATHVKLAEQEGDRG